MNITDKINNVEKYEYIQRKILPDGSTKSSTTLNKYTSKEKEITHKTKHYVNLNNLFYDITQKLRPEIQKTPLTITTESITLKRPTRTTTIHYDLQSDELYVFDKGAKNKTQIISTPQITYTNKDLNEDTLNSLITKYKEIFHSQKKKLEPQQNNTTNNTTPNRNLTNYINTKF
ncbi:MAG: hypothetical protein ACLFN8_01875 [Candidatus Woesearchaeota archaeon]